MTRRRRGRMAEEMLDIFHGCCCKVKGRYVGQVNVKGICIVKRTTQRWKRTKGVIAGRTSVKAMIVVLGLAM